MSAPMKREDVIQLARDACDKTKVDAFYNGYWTITQDELERVIHLATQKADAKVGSQPQSNLGTAEPQPEQPMSENPPFHRTRVWLHVMASLADAYIDRYAIQQLWWQSSISEGGINQHLTRPVHWAART